MEVRGLTMGCWQPLGFLKFSQKSMYVEEDRLHNRDWLPKINTAFLKKLLN